MITTSRPQIHRSLQTDQASIVKSLKCILQPGAVTELRALNAVTIADRRPHTESGYFDDPEKMAAAAATISSATGIYFVPNIINPALLARASNRMRAVFKEPLTADHDILRRIFLLVDLDPVRPAGISATDAEHDAALQVAVDIVNHLAAGGWPSPIYADSGNGAHLLYWIDLPADDGGLVKGCLEALGEKFSRAEVKVDTTTSNAARIWKLYGTPSAKGDSLPDRPHRLSRIIEMPKLRTSVPVDLLEALAGSVNKIKPPVHRADGSSNNLTFDVEKWIAENNVPVGAPAPWQGGRRWVFPVCPWNADHSDRSAFILQLESGAWAAGCHHNGCTGRNHESLRDVFEPGWRARKASRHLSRDQSATNSNKPPYFNGKGRVVDSAAIAKAIEELDCILQREAAALYDNADLLRCLSEVKRADPAKWAVVREKLRKAKIKLRDFDQALKPFPQTDATVQQSGPQYVTSAAGHICQVRQTADGLVESPLCNFDARIVEQVCQDDGAEQRMLLAIEGELPGEKKLPRVCVPAEQFAKLDWPMSAWGTRAVVHAGPGIKDHLRAALQLLSGDVPRRDVYGHLGWRELDGRWCYLHAGGAISADGPEVSVAVALPDALGLYVLPVPPSVDELVAAVRASLGLLDLAPARITFPLLAAIYRAPLGETDLSLHLCGPSGTFKSESAALAQQHYGKGLDARHLPASWSSTANAMEGLGFAAKDAILVVDDFNPTGSTADIQRAHRDADRLFRGQGNHSGRQRMRSDGTLRPARPPRGLPVSTGEDIPRGQSLRARMLIIEIGPSDIGKTRLTECQRDASGGQYAAAMAGYVRWLAPQFAALGAALPGETARLRDAATRGSQHARNPAIVGDLAFGLFQFLRFAAEVGALPECERDELKTRGWAALMEAASAQPEHQASGEPAQHFLRLLSAALASGRAHVADKTGTWPREKPEAFGWRAYRSGSIVEWAPQGKRIGWIDEHGVYLEPEASYAEAQKLASEQGDSLGITAPSLRKRLFDRGLLLSTDSTRKTLTIRRTFEQVRREVIHLRPECVVAVDSADADQSVWPPEPPSAGQVCGQSLQPINTELTSETARDPERDVDMVRLVSFYEDVERVSLASSFASQEELEEGVI